MEAVILIGLILINGFFALSEISLITARRARLQGLIDSGDQAAKVAVQLGSEPTKFLSTVQIGITSVAMLSGIVGEAAFAPPLETWLLGVGLSARASGHIATGLVVAMITYVAIVAGELVPKRIGQTHPESVARLVARPIRTLAMISRPFVWLLSASTRLLLRLFAIDDNRRNAVTEDEIRAVLAEGSELGVIEQHEHRMVRNLFRLDDLAIVSLMTPRGAIVMLDAASSKLETLAVLENSLHSRYPVFRRGQDDIIGVVSARDLLLRTLRSESLELEAITQPALFVPESISGMDLLEHFRQSGEYLAFVVDEYGTVLGLITLHDLLEAITGSIKDTTADDERAVRREDGSWLFDGQLSIHELCDYLGLRDTLEDPDGSYRTLSGLIIQELRRLPRIADRVRRAGWVFEVVDMDGHRIDRVLARSASAQSAAVGVTLATAKPSG
jgi:putative hemolysin